MSNNKRSSTDAVLTSTKKHKENFHDVVDRHSLSHPFHSKPQSIGRSMLYCSMPSSSTPSDHHSHWLNDILQQLESLPLHQRVQRCCLWKKLQSWLLTFTQQFSLGHDLDKASAALVQRIHDMLVLNLGSEVSFYSQNQKKLEESKESYVMEEIFRILVCCLEQCHRCHAMSLLSQEAKETQTSVMRFLTEVLFMAVSKSSPTSPQALSATPSASVSLTLTTLACLDALLVTTTSSIEKTGFSKGSSFHESYREDDLVLVLIQLAAKNVDGCNSNSDRPISDKARSDDVEKIAIEARNILSMLRSISFNTGRWKCQLAWDALTARPSQVVETLERKVFYWRCLAQIPPSFGGDTLHPPFAVVDDLVKTALKYGSMTNSDMNIQLANDAADCLADMAKRHCFQGGSQELEAPIPSDDMNVLWKALFSLLTTTTTLSVSVKKSAVSGVVSLITFNPFGLSQILPNAYIPNLLQSLRLVAQHDDSSSSSNCKQTPCHLSKRGADQTALEATRLLCHVSHHLNEHFEEQKQESLLAMRHLSAIIIHNKNTAIALEVVQTISQFITKFPHIIGSFPAVSHEVLSALACVIVSNWNSADVMMVDAKNVAVLSLWNLTQQPTCHLALVRHSQALEALVKVAATCSMRLDDGGGNVDHPPAMPAATANLALEALVQLSSNVVNRRLLAKQVGLLACLIRWARQTHSNAQQWQRLATTSPQAETSSKPTSENRQLLKDCIAHLAAVL